MSESLSVQQIIQDYESGISSVKIAEKYSVSKPTILSRLHNNGVVLRPRSQCNRKYLLDENVFEIINEESAYWIGFLMADGYITRNCVGLGLCVGDVDHLKKFISFLKSNHPYRIRPIQDNPKIKNASPQVSIEINSTKIIDDLAKYGIIKNKSAIAKVIGLENNRDFWRGVIDGDGSLFYSRGYPVLDLCGSYALVSQFKDYCFNIIKQNMPQVIKYKHSSCCFHFRFTGNKAQYIINNLYENASVYLERKMDLAQKMVKYGRIVA